tara:strand:- start:2416 stop:2880 length:465 start_codon:yes stop_codon:yes gene_type:complete
MFLFQKTPSLVPPFRGELPLIIHYTNEIEDIYLGEGVYIPRVLQPIEPLLMFQTIDILECTPMDMSSQYLRTYFAERNLTDRVIKIDFVYDFGDRSAIHFIELADVINMVINVAPANEQEQIANMIRKIEFSNPSAIHGFIDHLAYCYVDRNFY